MGRHSDADHDCVADFAESEQDHRAGLSVPPADDEQQYEMATARSFRAAASVASPISYIVDCHPVFQAGLSIDKVAAEGFAGLAVKASQGTSSLWAAGAKTWLDRADVLGLVTWCYHYVDTSSIAAQAQTVKTASHGRPVMMDFEANSGTVANLRSLIAACQRIGVRVPLAYVPRWYFQQLGSPSLAGLPPIVSSRYLTATGTASAIYSQVPASFWDSYGDGVTTVLQFSDRATVAGKQVDVNAFRGTKDQLRALVYGTSAPATKPRLAGTEYVMEPITVAPWTDSLGKVHNSGRVKRTLPVGSKSAVIAAAWLNFQAGGPGDAKIAATVYPLADSGGSGPIWQGSAVNDNADHGQRTVYSVPDATTTLLIDWTVTGSAGAYGLITPELQPH